MKALMATLMLTFVASTASAATTWNTGSGEFDKKQGQPTEQARNPHSWYGGDLYHGQR